MKRFLIYLIVITLSVAGCEESINESDPVNDNDNVYTSIKPSSLLPAEIGKSYNYSLDTLNVQSNDYVKIGTRRFEINNSDLSSGTYFCTEKYELSSALSEFESKFQITDNSIYFYADSTGTSGLIPDSVDMDISIIFDETFRLLKYPYDDMKEWSVFKAGANFGTFKFTVLSITGKYVGQENLQLPGFENSITAEKITYKIIINIPDISNPFVSKNQYYESNIWFSVDKGIVKIEGCRMFIDPISGRYFDIADSNKVIRHTLLSSN